MKTFIPTLCALTIAAILSACGQTGGLYLPQKTAPQQTNQNKA